MSARGVAVAVARGWRWLFKPRPRPRVAHGINADAMLMRLVRETLEAQPVPRPCPLEDLFAYFMGVLDPVEADIVQEHIARCQQCARVVADLEAFPRLDPPDEERDTPSDADTAHAYAELCRLITKGKEEDV